jgi:hypothetical protein
MIATRRFARIAGTTLTISGCALTARKNGTQVTAQTRLPGKEKLFLHRL